MSKIVVGDQDIYYRPHDTYTDYDKFLRKLSREDFERLNLRRFNDEDPIKQVANDARERRAEIHQTLRFPKFSVGRTGKLSFHRQQDGMAMQGEPEIEYKWIQEVFNPHIEADLACVVDRVSGQPHR